MTTIYTYNNKVLKNSSNDKWLTKKYIDPYNPLGLPANTVRVRTSNGNVPYKSFRTSYNTATLVQGTSDVYDVYKSGTSFGSLLSGSNNVVEVLGANTTGITQMYGMFHDCSSLTSVQLFDTSNVTTMESMFLECSNLTSVPLFDTSNVTNMNSMLNLCGQLTTIPLFDTSKATDMGYMFSGCTRVQSGALALYQQASTQTTPPSNHNNTFNNCGRDTTTGGAELAQIPSSWGGTGA